jgi:hypothetical protein
MGPAGPEFANAQRQKGWGPSTGEFCGEGNRRCDADRSTKPGGEESFAVSFAGSSTEELAMVAGAKTERRFF